MKFKIDNNVLSIDEQSAFVGAGGEANIYHVGSSAVKIYHNPAGMIPVGKMLELSSLKSKGGVGNVVVPEHVVYDLKNSPIGFSMQWLGETQYLCRLFANSFKTKNNITDKQVYDIIFQMAKIMRGVHDFGFLMIDPNEMNWLLNKAMDEVYSIDADSFKTHSYGPTAIMESIRDRKVSNNQFTKDSDWFSLAVVLFQLYTGVHPYKGIHPNFGKDWAKMMDNNVSVFDSHVTLPNNVKPPSVIPEPQRKYFERVFQYGERGPFPTKDYVPVSATQFVPRTVINSSTVEVEVLASIGENIIDVSNNTLGIPCFVTKHGTYVNTSKAGNFNYNGSARILCCSDGMFVVYKDKNSGAIIVNNFLTGNQEKELAGFCDFFIAKDKTDGNTHLFCLDEAKRNLFKINFLLDFTTTLSKKSVSVVPELIIHLSNPTIYYGCVLQNILGKYVVVAPSGGDYVIEQSLPELDGSRVTDAWYERGVLVVISEKRGKYKKYVFKFINNDKVVKVYDAVESLDDIRATVKENKTAVVDTESGILIFNAESDSCNFNVLKDVSLPDGCELATFLNKTLVVDGKSLKLIKPKKS